MPNSSNLTVRLEKPSLSKWRLRPPRSVRRLAWRNQARKERVKILMPPSPINFHERDGFKDSGGRSLFEWTFPEGGQMFRPSRDLPVLGPGYTFWHKVNSNLTVCERAGARGHPPKRCNTMNFRRNILARD